MSEIRTHDPRAFEQENTVHALGSAATVIGETRPIPSAITKRATQSCIIDKEAESPKIEFQ
jgi:hypothetical protein